MRPNRQGGLRWWLVAGSVLAACTAPEPAPQAAMAPAAPARQYWPRVFTVPPPLFTFAQADSVAQSLGCVTDVAALHYSEHNNWRELAEPGRFPVATRYVPLSPGQLPGLRGRLHADSLHGYVHGGQWLEFHYATLHPVFSGPRASRQLQRVVDQQFTVKGAINEVRTSYGHLYPDAEPLPPAEEDYLPRIDDDLQLQQCRLAGAYLLPLDTIVSAYYTGYSGGHGVHGYGRAGTLHFSLARQREVEVHELFRPELGRALSYIVAAYTLAQNSHWYTYYKLQQQPPFRSLGAGGFFYAGPLYSTEGLLAWQQNEQGRQQLLAILRQLRAAVRQQEPATGYGGTNFTYNADGNSFYFAPEGVVFCIGDDLSRWRILLPYAHLPRYLCPVSDAPTP